MNRWSNGLKEIHEARKKANAKQQQLVQRYKDVQSAAERDRHARAAALEIKRHRFHFLSVDDALNAARRLSFVDLEAESRQTISLNRPSLELIERFLYVLRDRQSTAVLQWPRGIRDLSILHPLSMLATLGGDSRFQDPLLPMARKRHRNCATARPR